MADIVRIGAGCLAQVFKVVSEQDGSVFAMKKVGFMTHESLKVCQDEVEKLKTLSHPHIVKHIGTTAKDFHLYVFLEYFGSSVASKLPLDESVIKKYTRHMLLGLEYLHANKIVHGCLKAGNLLVDKQDNIKLADFSASKQLPDQAMNDARLFEEIVYWLSPENLRTRWGPCVSSDIWCVGCTVIEMATGRPPWSDESLDAFDVLYKMDEVFAEGERKYPPIPPNLSPEAKKFLLRCFMYDDKVRPSASMLLEDPFLKDESEKSSTLNSNSSDKYCPADEGSFGEGVPEDDEWKVSAQMMQRMVMAV